METLKNASTRSHSYGHPRKAREGLKAASPVVYTSVRLRTQGWGLKTNV